MAPSVLATEGPYLESERGHHARPAPSVPCLPPRNPHHIPLPPGPYLDTACIPIATGYLAACLRGPDLAVPRCPAHHAPRTQSSRGLYPNVRPPRRARWRWRACRGLYPNVRPPRRARWRWRACRGLYPNVRRPRRARWRWRACRGLYPNCVHRDELGGGGVRAAVCIQTCVHRDELGGGRKPCHAGRPIRRSWPCHCRRTCGSHARWPAES